MDCGSKCTQPAELLDIYPSLAELCGLPVNPKVEGLSLGPQLKDPKAPRERPAITTHNHDNHGVRSERWRYIVYADGSEELYDMKADPNEWANLASDPNFADIIAGHRRWLPEFSRPPAPGSHSRILTRDKSGKVTWEGKQIRATDPIPEISGKQKTQRRGITFVLLSLDVETGFIVSTRFLRSCKSC